MYTYSVSECMSEWVSECMSVPSSPKTPPLLQLDSPLARECVETNINGLFESMVGETVYKSPYNMQHILEINAECQNQEMIM